MDDRIAAVAPGPVTDPEFEGLLQFFYQCPVGLIETDDRGTVRRMNPAAARMLTPALTEGEDLTGLLGLLERLSPGLARVLTRDPGERGPLDTGRRIVVDAGGRVDGRVEIELVRVDRDTVMIVCSDVTEEIRLARHTLELTRRLRDVVSATGVYRHAAAQVLQITVSGVMALEELLVRGPRTPSALARRLGLTTTTMTTIIDQLEQAGLACRTPNPQDRRSILVVLAPEAEPRIRPAVDLLTGGVDRVLERGTDAGERDVAAVLDAVTSALRTRALLRRTVPDAPGAPGGPASAQGRPG